MTTNNLIIDETNFNQYFFDARTHRPQKGQALACYEAVAELVDGDLKRDIVNSLLFNDQGAMAAQHMLQKLGFASYKDSIRVVKMIAEDLVDGKDIWEVLNKPYDYHLQMFYYTQKEYIPKNDIHWSSINLLNLIDNSKYKYDEGILNDN